MTPGPSDQRSITMSATDEQLRAAVGEGNIPLLLLVLAQFTGDGKWLEEPYRPTRTIALYDNDDGGLSDDIQREIRAAAFEAIRRWRDGESELPGPPRGQRLIEMLSVSLGEDVPPEYAGSMAEEAGFVERGGMSWSGERPAGADDLNVVIIGAGPSGIGAAAALRRLGIRFTVIEKNPGPGGVWWNNDYPGAGVDTPSHMYSFSFAPRRGWTRFYADQDEILSYFRGVADEFGVTESIQFDTEVVRAVWVEDSQSWQVHVRTAGGEEEILAATAVISCVGVLNRPAIPNFEGMDHFAGPMFHSSQWDHSLKVEGKRVAVIGTGATSMQLVPALAGVAKKVLVFQRSPQWIAPNPTTSGKPVKGFCC